MKKKNNKKLNKIIIAMTIIIIALSSVVIYAYWDKHVTKKIREEKVFLYKKNIYEAALCQYSCPLTLQNVNNETLLLPNKSCLLDCSKKIDRELVKLNFSLSEIYNDNLLKEMESIVKKCKTNNQDAVSKKVNSSRFFNCSSNDMGNLKVKYPYL